MRRAFSLNLAAAILLLAPELYLTHHGSVGVFATAEPEPEPESQPEPETEDEPKSEFDDQKRLLFALDETPLSKNPFFIVSMANKFKENGTEGAKADISGYTCKLVGTLECKNHNFQCTGSGAIDCTGDCPGDEAMVEELFSLMSNTTLGEKYPVLAYLKEMQDKRNASQKRAGTEFLKKVMVGCNYGKYITLLDLELNAGSNFLDNANKVVSNTSIEYVAPDALSGFDDYYDYDYDEEDEEENNLDLSTETTTVVQKRQVTEDKPQLNSAEHPTIKIMRANGKVNSIEIVDGKNETSYEHSDPKESPINQRNIPKRDSTRKRRSTRQTLQKRIRREVREFRANLLATMAQIPHQENPGSPSDVQAKEVELVTGDLDSSVIDVLKRNFEEMPYQKVRKIRSLAADDMGNDEKMPSKCRVKGMNCVKFPTTDQCAGIGVGGCFTNIQLLGMLFSPKIIYSIVAIIIVCFIVVTVVTVLYYKRNNNQVIPTVESNRGIPIIGQEGKDNKSGTAPKVIQVPLYPGPQNTVTTNTTTTSPPAPSAPTASAPPVAGQNSEGGVGPTGVSSQPNEGGGGTDNGNNPASATPP